VTDYLLIFLTTMDMECESCFVFIQNPYTTTRYFLYEGSFYKKKAKNIFAIAAIHYQIATILKKQGELNMALEEIIEGWA